MDHCLHARKHLSSKPHLALRPKISIACPYLFLSHLPLCQACSNWEAFITTHSTKVISLWHSITVQTQSTWAPGELRCWVRRPLSFLWVQSPCPGPTGTGTKLQANYLFIQLCSSAFLSDIKLSFSSAKTIQSPIWLQQDHKLTFFSLLNSSLT